MNRLSMVIVLAEDERHKMLSRRFLIDCGCRPHAIRAFLSPAGRGSAENWVRSQFPREVAVYRRRHAQSALVVVIDADMLSVKERIAQLERALMEAGVAGVVDGERIARVIPKRNIETWILCLNGETVDEANDFKKRGIDWNQLIPEAAQSLCGLVRSGSLPANLIDSLRTGVTELRRLH